MSNNTDSVGLGRTMVFIIAILMLLRGLAILFIGENSNQWGDILGTSGVANADAQFGIVGSIVRILQLIEGRFWIIAAFPLIFRLSWGRDVTIGVAILGMAIQLFRLFTGNVASAGLWLLLYAGIVVLFYSNQKIKAYFAQAPDKA